MKYNDIVNQYIENKNYESAINYLRSLIDKNPYDNNSRLMIVDIMINYYKNPDFTVIKKILRTAENMVPDDIRPSIKLCEFYLNKDNIASAERRINRVLEINPNNYTIRFFQTRIEAIKGRREKAIESYEELCRERDDNHVRLDLSRLYLAEEDYDNSLRVINNALMFNPNDAIVILEKVIVFLVKGDYEIALNYLNQNKDILSKIRHTADVKYYLNYMLGKEEHAKTYFERQLTKYSKSDCIYEAKKRYYDIRRTSIKPIFTCDYESIKELYTILRDLVSNLEPISRGLCDKYVVDLGYVYGKINQVDTPKVMVKTINNTPYILDFHPISKEYAESRQKKMS